MSKKMTVADLDLVTVYCDGDTDLVSLSLGEVLAYDIAHGPNDRTPHFDMIEDGGQTNHETDICLWANLDPDGGFPGWDLVIAYLKTHRHLLR